MNSPSKVSVPDYCFQDLPMVTDLGQSGALIQSHIKGHTWEDSFNCITELRKINKHFPQYIPDIIERFSSTVLDLINNGKTLIVKNIFKLIKELFDAGQQINVQKAVYAFLPTLIRKASTDIGYMKTSAQEVLTSFSQNCGYEISFLISSEFCCDKNSAIAELSIKLLDVLVQRVGAGVMQLNENTLSSLVRSLSFLIDGKRKNLKTSALNICLFLCDSIGSQNYLKLMQFCLKDEEINSMGNSMESHRLGKQKPVELKQVVQNRKTELLNADFFNENKLNSNFVPLAQVNMNNQGYQNNYNYGNVNNQQQQFNYNGEGRNYY